MGICRCLSTALLVVIPLVTSGVVYGQSGLSTEVVMSNAALSGAQQNQINEHVSRGVAQLVSGDRQEVSAGRRWLVEPFSRPGVTEMFLASYSPAISRELIASGALENESPLVRTNAMIVASHLSDSGVVLLIRQGLTDAAPSVRYWAAVTAINAGGKLSQSDQESVLNVLNARWQEEMSIDVLEKILLAMDALRTPQAGLQLLAALNHRVNIHAGDPALPIRAEVEGLQGVTVRTFTNLTAPGQTVNPAMLRQLVIVLFRYFDLSNRLLTNPQTPEANREDLHRLTRIAGNFLPRLTQRLAPEARLPAGQPSATDDSINRLLVEEWRRALTSSQVGIAAGDLSVTAAAPAAPAASAQPAEPTDGEDTAETGNAEE